MELYTQEQYQKLVKNGSPEQQGVGHLPVVKWFTPDANCTWIVSEIIDEDTAFGICDLGLGFPEVGYISLQQIKELRGQLNLPVERDLHFEPKFSIEAYAEAARLNGAITEDFSKLNAAAEVVHIRDVVRMRLHKNKPEGWL